MFKIDKAQIASMLLSVGLLGCAAGSAAAAVRVEGQVQAGRGPLANSTVTLWAASADEPRQLGQTRTNSDGRFEITSQETPSPDATLYIVAKGGEATVNKGSGDNPAAALLAVLGNAPPPAVIGTTLSDRAAVSNEGKKTDEGKVRVEHDGGPL